MLSDTAAKGILAKASSFTAFSTKKFQVKTAIVKGIKKNWSSILFFTLNNMVPQTKKSKSFAIKLSILLEDAGFPLDAASALHKFKTLNAQSILLQNPWSLDLSILPADSLVVKK